MKTIPRTMGPVAKQALPRQFSRILGKLSALPFAESVDLARTAYDQSSTPRQRVIAMRLRLRVLQDHFAALHAAPAPQDDVIDAIVITDTPPPAIDIPVVDEKPAPRKRAPKMMQMNLESDALSLMMDALGDSTDAD